MNNFLNVSIVDKMFPPLPGRFKDEQMWIYKNYLMIYSFIIDFNADLLSSTLKLAFQLYITIFLVFCLSF